jgi:hypothetical protein
VAAEPVRTLLRADFEYAVLALTEAATVDGVPLSPGPMLYLGSGPRGRHR